MNKKKDKTKKNKNKQKYKITNWREYNQALVKRGSLEIWIADDAPAAWYAPPAHKQGSPLVYSDAAITTCLTIAKVFNLRLRQTEGFLLSVFKLSETDLDVPDYSTLSRRSTHLPVNLPKKPKEKVIIVVDSTGIKVYGEGEWKVRKHGYSKRRTWRKVHIGINRDGEVRAVVVTKNDVDDASVTKELLDQEEAKIEALAGDGAYDTHEVYQECGKKGVQDIRIPPRENAVIAKHGNSHGPPYARDEHIRAIRQSGLKCWKQQVDYHARSLVENTMFRLKTIFGDKLHARKWENEVTEIKLEAAILNRMFELGMPKTVKAPD